MDLSSQAHKTAADLVAGMMNKSRKRSASEESVSRWSSFLATSMFFYSKIHFLFECNVKHFSLKKPFLVFNRAKVNYNSLDVQKTFFWFQLGCEQPLLHPFTSQRNGWDLHERQEAENHLFGLAVCAHEGGVRGEPLHHEGWEGQTGRIVGHLGGQCGCKSLHTSYNITTSNDGLISVTLNFEIKIFSVL